MPAVVGLHDVSRRVPPGASVIIDGETGDVVIDPTPALWQEAEGRSSSRRITVLTHEEDGPLQTSDGEPIVLHANIERSDDVPIALDGTRLDSPDKVIAYLEQINAARDAAPRERAG